MFHIVKTNQSIKDKLQSGFFGFWIRYWRFTFLVIFLILGLGIFSLFKIPKESTPEIDIATISVSTVYPGVSPKDIDTLITTKLEDALSDIDGIDKIRSNSALSISQVILSFKNGVDMTQSLVKVKDAVDTVSLPEGAKDPVVKEITTDNTLMFNALIYSTDPNLSFINLKERVKTLASSLEGRGSIHSIDFDIFGSNDIVGNSGGGDSYYEIQVLLNKAKVEELGLSVRDIQNTILAWNQNWPLGNYTVGELNYDFRIDGELTDIASLEQIPVNSLKGQVMLSDIAQIRKVLTDDTVSKMGLKGEGPFNYVLLGFHKRPGANIFSSEAKAKEILEQELKKYQYEDIHYMSVSDLGEIIIDDYNQLAQNMLQTFILVFICLLIFVGFKESLIATISLPLAFFITFIVLNWLGLTLNFLTNFSLIVTLGIAIDTTIVVIEGAHERMRQGFSAKHAILLSVRDYKLPLITGTATTVVVFIPLMTLPGVMGKFLAYIPITIFITLFAALFISLTINSALYYKLSKNGKYYDTTVGDQDFMSEESRQLLDEDRVGKTEKVMTESTSYRDKFFDRISLRYSNILARVMKNPRSRLFSILFPLLLLLLSILFISPRLGFTLMPDNDNGRIIGTIEAQEGTDQVVMQSYIDNVAQVLQKIPELKTYYIKINQGIITVNIELKLIAERKSLGQRTDFEVADYIDNQFIPLVERGLKINFSIVKNGPPATEAVGIKFIADSPDDIPKLITVANDFYAHMKGISYFRNITISSKNTPGEFVYRLDINKLKMLGLTPAQVNSQIYAITNASNAGSIKGDFADNNIKVLYENYHDKVSMNDIGGIQLSTRDGAITFGDISHYVISNTLSLISRENGVIYIKVGADVTDAITADVAQRELLTYAEKYSYPEGISYSRGGETEENSDLLISIGVSFIVAVLVIFCILLLQFNSYMQPFIIMYSIAMGLLGANIGLFLFGLPYSIMFFIGYIALAGVIVNDSIVFIDRISNNLRKGMDRLYATKEAGKARLQPILLTTLTTVLGLISIVSDGLWKPLAITMMFGMVVGSISTLFVTPALFYDVDKIRYLLRKNILTPLLFLLPIPFLYFGIHVILYLLGFTIPFFVLLIIWGIFSLGYMGFYFWKARKDIHTEGASFIQRVAELRLVDQNGDYLSIKRTTQVLVCVVLVYLSPLLLAVFLGFVFGIVNYIPLFIFVFYFLIGLTNLYFVWTNELNQTWLDKILKIKYTY